eukprot:2241500-Rhodomonas_salina.2
MEAERQLGARDESGAPRSLRRCSVTRSPDQADIGSRLRRGRRFQASNTGLGHEDELHGP